MCSKGWECEIFAVEVSPLIIFNFRASASLLLMALTLWEGRFVEKNMPVFLDCIKVGHSISSFLFFDFHKIFAVIAAKVCGRLKKWHIYFYRLAI